MKIMKFSLQLPVYLFQIFPTPQFRMLLPIQSPSGSIHLLFSTTEYSAEEDLSEQYTYLSFGVLRSDESFVPKYCNQILFH